MTMNYDPKSVSFSMAGSTLVVRITPPWKQRPEGLYLQTVPKRDFLQLTLRRGDRFVAVQSGSHRSPDKGDSLIPFAPLILGRRLPADIARALVNGLLQPDRFLTAHGLATESPKSPLYEPDGYWRGPVWAPPTHMIYDGLRQLGERDRAREVARRFCETCRTSGLPENFDALTGAPLRDKAYTWTASVFLLLANDLLAD